MFVIVVVLTWFFVIVGMKVILSSSLNKSAQNAQRFLYAFIYILPCTVVAIHIYISSIEPSVEGGDGEVVRCRPPPRCSPMGAHSRRAASRWSSERTSTPSHKGARKSARLTRKLTATVAPRKKRQEATVDPASHAAVLDDL